jgi:type IV pilus assembly protein PilM
MRLSGMFFGKKSLGVEIGPGGVVFALLGGSPAAPALEQLVVHPLASGIVQGGLRNPNITDPQAFSDCLRQARDQLLHSGANLSVTLPDTVGRVMLMNVEERFKSRSEGEDIIRWKLKKSMPLDAGDTHLDYQNLGVQENNDMALLVTLVSRSVIGQYEEVLATAGLVPTHIDLNLFNIYRVFERRLALLEEYALISLYKESLSIMIMGERGFPEFLRVKDLSGVSAGDSRVYREISNSLFAYREGRVPREVACVAAPEAAPVFCEMVSEATSKKALLLETRDAVKPLPDAPADQPTLFPATAAIGAALRNL